MVNYVNLTQAVFGYYTKYEKNYYRSTLDLALNWSFGRWLPDQQNYKYNQLRHSAKNKYVYGKAVWNNIWRFPHDIMFYFKATGQLSNRNLLPSEELGIGGLYTVRGYYERELNGDNGLILNTELHSPTINIIRQHEPNKSKDGLQFLIFFDYGLDTVKHQQVNESKTQFLYGYGPGARFVIDPYVEARLDLGFKGERKQEYKGGSHLWHFTVTVSY